MRCALSPTMDFGSSQQSVRSQALRGRARSGGSSGEHAMKIIERDVAGASSGERFIKHARCGGDAQRSVQRRGAQKVYPFADWEQGARAPRKTLRPDPSWC